MKKMAKRFSAILTALAVCASLFIGLNLGTQAASTGSYVKVTEAPADWSGDYLIVYEDENMIFNGSLTSLDAVNNYKTVTIEKGEKNTIAASDEIDKATFTIAKSASGYTIKAASGSYIGNSSDANALKTDKAYDNTITLNSDYTVNIVSAKSYLRFNTTSGQDRFRYYKSSSYTGQKAITLYKYVEAGAVECEHTNTTTTTTPATKTEAGSTVVVCDECGTTVSTTPIPALGCDVSYVVPEGETVPNGTTGVLEVTLPEPEALTGEYAKEYEFAGWAEEKVEFTDKAPALHKAGDKVTLEDDTTFYAVYKYSEKAEGEVPVSNSYVKKDLGDIVATDTVIITMTKSGTVYALTSVNGSSNPPPAKAITVTNNEIASAADEFLWTVENTADGYVFHPAGKTTTLYCTNDNNGVRVGTNNNKYFEVASNGYLMNKATSRYVGIYNTQDWRCYTTDPTSNNIKGQTLAFYAKSASDGTTTYYTSTPEVAGGEDKVILGASVDVGSDLTMNFYVDDAKLTDSKMTFTMDGKTVTVEKNAQGAFAFEGVPPHCMTETITAKLYDGDELVETMEYSVKENLQALLKNPGLDETTKQFVSNMLYYGDAAQNYKGNNDELATDDVENLLAATTELPTASNATLSAEGTNVAYFKSANVWFDNVNKLIIKFNELPENTKLLVNDIEVSFDGVSYMTDGILATEFDTVYEFTLVNEDAGFTQTLTYSVNDYVYAISNSATASDNMKELALALYNYGVYADLVK